jgi:FkbM family methyltransferase
VTVTTEGTFFLNPVSNLGYRLSNGEYEPSTRAILLKYLGPGAIFVDVGANEGYFSVLGSRLVGPEGKVIAVEPQTRLQEILRINLARNECSNVEVVAAAVAARTERVRLNLAPEMNVGSTSLFRNTKYPLKTEEVQAYALDEFLETVGGRCDLMKMDIEGAEYDALWGRDELLKSGAIRHLCIEVHDRALVRRSLSWEPIHQLLTRCGYEWDGNRDPRVYRFGG